MPLPDLSIPIAPYRLSGIVYGTLLNHSSALAALGDAVNQPPYQAPPKAPVLYVKPRNTLAASGQAITLPKGMDELQVGACVGVVIGRTAARLTPTNALEHVAGFVILNDVSIPHDSFYRPSVRLKCHDGFCPLGGFVAASKVTNPDALTLKILIDGKLVQEVTTADMIRKVAQLLTDVTDFMTLAPGDVLATGVAAGAARVRANQHAEIRLGEFSSIQNHFVAGAA